MGISRHHPQQALRFERVVVAVISALPIAVGILLSGQQQRAKGNPSMAPLPARQASRCPLSVEQRLAGQALGFHDAAQALKRLDLDLPDPFTGKADFTAHLFQGAAFVTTQAESP